MPTLEARALGRRRPLVSPWTVPLPPLPREGSSLTLRDLIEAAVRGEVRAFRERAEARAFLRALSAPEIEAGIVRGMVDPGGRDVAAEVDEEEAIRVALRAFEDGMYLVVIDDVERHSLMDTIEVRDDSRVIFLRLTFLAGA